MNTDKLAACERYLSVIDMIRRSNMPAGIYAFESMREEAHEALCDAFDLDHMVTKDITDDLSEDPTWEGSAPIPNEALESEARSLYTRLELMAAAQVVRHDDTSQQSHVHENPKEKGTSR